MPVNRNFYIHRKIRRKIKNLFIDPGKRFSRPYCPFFIVYRSGNQQLKCGVYRQKNKILLFLMRCITHAGSEPKTGLGYIAQIDV